MVVAAGAQRLLLVVAVVAVADMPEEYSTSPREQAIQLLLEVAITEEPESVPVVVVATPVLESYYQPQVGAVA